MTAKEYAAQEKKLLKVALRDNYAGRAMTGLLACRDTNRRLTDGELVFLVEDSWKMDAAMLKGRP